nr:uncharacterized protein LOC113802185 isoform X1 [Penaeus vannamei]
MTSQSPDHSSSQSSNSKRPRNPPCEENKEKQTKKRKKSGSKRGNPVSEKEIPSKPVEDKVSTVEVSTAEEEEMQCEILTEAIMESLDEAAKKLGRVRKLNVAVVKKMHSIWRYTLEEGRQSHPPSVISAAFSKLVERHHMNGKGKVDPKPKNKCKKADEGSLRTPTSRDYLQAKHTSDIRLPQTSAIESKEHSVLDVTLNTEKTIISPRALLKQYENKLDLTNSDKLKDSMHISGTGEISLEQENINKDRMECSGFAQAKEHKDVSANLETITDITSQCHAKGRGIRTPKFHRAMSASCPKTVVVNPINFLQRYEEQSKEQPRKDHCVNTGYESPSSSVDYFMQVLSKNGQRQKSLDSNVRMSRTDEYWRSKNSNNCYFLDTRQDELGDGKINEGEICKIREGCNGRKCMTNTGSRISAEQAKFESDNSAIVDRFCYPPDALVQKMRIAPSHSICNSSVPHFSLNSYSLSHPDDSHFNVISSDKYASSSVLNKPVMHPMSQIQDIYQRHIPSTVSMAHSKLDHRFLTDHPPGDPTLRNMTQPKESVFSTMNDHRQGSGRPPFMHTQSHACCKNSEGAWPFQGDYQYGSTYNSRRQYVPEGAPYPLTGFNYDLKSNICGDEPCSEGSSQNSSSQEVTRLQHPHPHPAGRDGNAACVRDWVDHREPQEIWPPNSHCNQITSRSEFSPPKLCVESNPSPEERFYRRKLY